MEFVLEHINIGVAIRIGALIAIGMPLLSFVYRLIYRSLQERLSDHIAKIASHAVYYAGLLFLLVSVLNDLGFQLSALLGAAGIAGIAVGFAAQTTVSNVISGIFLLLEQSFKVGDVVTCDGHIGVVESIDILSVKLTTFDNQLVRIPNETFIKKSVINRSFYPNRRLDIKVRIRHEADLQKALDILEALAKQHSNVLQDPAPLIAIDTVSSWATAVLFRVWLKQQDYFAAHRDLVKQIKTQCDAAKIKVSVE